ncbi:MAG: hypothetical protein K6G15_06220 [Desulfovibrio sp.]|nr:hypothetical protein [Desulfovibrio sp.]
MSGINGLSSTPENNYGLTIESGQTDPITKGSRGKLENPGLPSELGQNDPSVSNRGFVPDAPSGNVDMSSLSGFVASLSPGAMLAAVLVQDAAQQNQENVTELMKRSQSVQKSMIQQADNIKDAARDQLILTCFGAGVSMLGSAIGTFVGVRGTGDVFKANQMRGQCISQVTANAGSILSSIGTYLNAKAQAENKILDSSIEQQHTTMEIIKNSMQQQRDLISKSIEFINTMQASRNQTLSRIMG